MSDLLAEVQARIGRKNQVLFRKDDPLLLDLYEQVRQQNRRTLIQWALSLAEETAAELAQKYPADLRPGQAVAAAKAWAAGEIKMPVAKRAILACHAMAKALEIAEDIALCHAVGQACSVVHTAGHAMGYPVYELTALVRRHGLDEARDVIASRLQTYQERLLFWQRRESSEAYHWAPFLK